MKNIIIVILLLILATITHAQKEVVGVWNMTEITVGEETMTVNMHVDFNEDGKLYISGRELGSWEFDSKNNTLSANAEMQLENINGVNEVTKLSAQDLVLINPHEGAVTFKRISLPYGEEFKNDIVGLYLFSKVVTETKTEEIGNTTCTFSDDGILYFEAMFVGTWSYDEKNKYLSIDAPEIEELNGENAVIQADDKLVLLTKDAAKYFFIRLDKEKIIKNNLTSGLTGLWTMEFVYPDGYKEANFLYLKEPYEYSFEQADESFSGMWLFDKKEKSLTIVGSHIKFSGINTIVEISEGSFTFKDKSGIERTAVRTKQDAKNIEYLDYDEEEFFYIDKEETSMSPKLDIDISLIPWSEFYDNVEYLKNVTSLKYTYYKPIEKFEVFEKAELTASINYNEEENIVEIDDIYDGFSGENVNKIMYGELNFFDQPTRHPYFIIDEMLTGKIIEQEQIITPAGTFNCTVIEGYSDYDNKIKLWMINDKPGVYAKIIKSGINIFDEIDYSMLILDKINRSE